MDELLERARGEARAAVTGTQPQNFLNACARQGVTLKNCKSVSGTELRCTVPRRYLAAAARCARQSQCEMRVLSRRGAGYAALRLKRRHALLLGLFTLLLLLGAASLRVWDIDVVGNERVPTAEILGALESCGVAVGADWTDFDADLIRSRVLEQIPELSFLTVNVRGSRAQVIVRERIPLPALDDGAGGGDIVAARSGVVERVDAFRGVAAVRPGDAVLAGDTLISGRVPGVEIWGAETKYRDVSPLGQVWARTEYEFTAADAPELRQKVPTGRRADHYALIFAGKRLNFYQNTGIYRTGCDTIYTEWTLGLGELFTLPVSLLRETQVQYTLQRAQQTEEETAARLKDVLAARLDRALSPEGRLLSADYEVRREDGAVVVTLRAQCLENIAQKTGDRPGEEENGT